MSNFKLNLLVLEDVEEVARELRNQFDISNPHFNPVWVKNVAAAKREFSSKLFHVVSIDQRVPQSESPKPYDKDDASFSAVLAAYAATQPIATGVVLTGFGSISPAVDAEKHGLTYIQKGPNAVNEWRKKLNRLHDDYFTDVLLKRGVCRLPNTLARSVQHLRDQEHPRMKLLAARDIFENSTRMMTCLLTIVALADRVLHRDARDAIKRVYEDGEPKIAKWIVALRVLTSMLDQATSKFTQLAALEIQRFLISGSQSVLNAVDSLFRLRNELAHDRLQEPAAYQAILGEHRPAIQAMIECCFVLSIHPILGNVEQRPVTSGLPLYRADDYRGDSVSPPSIDVRCDDHVDGELVWAHMNQPGISSRFFRLAPLFRSVGDHGSAQSGLYLLDNPKRGEYRELSTGRRYTANEKEKQEIRDLFRD